MGNLLKTGNREQGIGISRKNNGEILLASV